MQIHWNMIQEAIEEEGYEYYNFYGISGFIRT